MYGVTIICFLFMFITENECILRKKLFPEPAPLENCFNDCGEPLFLTPLIESGRVKEAKEKSLVRNLSYASEVESYSGFFTVSKQYNSNMFFWFFKSKSPKAPVVVWLQGGPGGSSLFG
ncbi:venom serine carboxypeptidase-like protein, partial [Leptotrombidium deliense]